MTEQILQLEERAHLCSLAEIGSVQTLQHIVYEVANLIKQEVSDDKGFILSDISIQLNEAAEHLSMIEPIDTSINKWMRNLQEFSKAKAEILYSLNLLQAALRFGKLLPLKETLDKV